MLLTKKPSRQRDNGGFLRTPESVSWSGSWAQVASDFCVGAFIPILLFFILGGVVLHERLVGVSSFHPSWTRLPPRETFGLELATIGSRRLCFHTHRGQDSRAGPTSWLLHTDKPSGSPWVPHWSCRKMQTPARSTTFPSRARSLQN